MNENKDIIEVSVIIPNFNYGRYIEECIISVLKSDFDFNKLEIIVIDDGSTDNSVSIIKKIISKTSVKIILIEKESNSGQPQTRNLGIANAKGNYLFFLDSDNYIRQDCLKKHFEFLSQNLDYSVAYAPIQRFDDATGENLFVFSNEIYDPEKLVQENYIDNMAMLKRADFLEVGMFDENVIGWEDYELWLRLRSKDKKMFFIEGEPLSFYRVHDNSWSNTVSLVHQQDLKSYIDAKHGLDISKGVDNYNIPSTYSIESITRAKIKVCWSQDELQFKEENSQSKYLKLDSLATTAVFCIDTKKLNVQYLRIDIADRVGFLNIHDIIIQDREGNFLWEWNKNEIKNKSDVLFIESPDFFQQKTIQLSTGTTPSFVVKIINSNPDKLINELNIQVSLSFVDPHQHELLVKTINKPLTYISPRDIHALQTTINSINSEKANLLDQLQLDNVLLSNFKNENALFANYIETKNTLIEELTNGRNRLMTEQDEKNEIISRIFLDKDNLENTIQELNKLLKDVVDQKKKLISIIQKQQNQLTDLINKEEKNQGEQFTTIEKATKAKKEK